MQGIVKACERPVALDLQPDDRIGIRDQKQDERPECTGKRPLDPVRRISIEDSGATLASADSARRQGDPLLQEVSFMARNERREIHT